MKRNILAVGLFAVCTLAVFSSESQAWGLFHHRYVTKITCRPYNAFTPICWGNLVCDGCVPNPCGVAGGCLPLTMGVPNFPCSGGACVGMPYLSDPHSASVTDLPPVHTAPTPNFTPPQPMPVGPNTTMRYAPPVAQANYYPIYMPQYQPNYYTPGYYSPNQGWPQTQPMPYYWYNGR